MVALLERLAQGYRSLGLPARLALTVGLPALTFVVGMAVVVVLPSDHFVREHAGTGFWQRHALLRAVVRVFRNGLGMLMLPLGIVMALPLVPGPGLLFILLGVSLLDVPGKRRLERRLFAYPRVLRAANHMRLWFSRPPLLIPPVPPPAREAPPT